jgi:hypothetical protein
MGARESRRWVTVAPIPICRNLLLLLLLLLLAAGGGALFCVVHELAHLGIGVRISCKQQYRVSHADAAARWHARVRVVAEQERARVLRAAVQADEAMIVVGGSHFLFCVCNSCVFVLCGFRFALFCFFFFQVRA